MITLDRDQLTNILAENINLFSNFPVVENYCNIQNLPQGAEGFRRLTQEIEASKDLYDLIARCISSEFKIDKDNYIIENGFQLSSLIAQKKVEISDGEKTWIQNIEKIEEALKGACCSTRHALVHEANACYSDLINQCNDQWIFIKNLKKSLNVSKITFKLPDNSKKQV